MLCLKARTQEGLPGTSSLRIAALSLRTFDGGNMVLRMVWQVAGDILPWYVNSYASMNVLFSWNEVRRLGLKTPRHLYREDDYHDSRASIVRTLGQGLRYRSSNTLPFIVVF
jgi:hypothetical protein